MAAHRTHICESSPAKSGRIARGRHVGKPSLQHGTFAIMFAPLLIVIIGFTGLALELGHIYNRKVDMHGVAKAAALAAARELNGTAAGIAAARTAARDTIEALRYHHFNNGASVTWSDAALSFGSTPDRAGTWIPSSSAGSSSGAQIGALYYARVDTDALDPAIGQVNTVFMRVLSAQLASVRVTESAVAGRTSLNVTPIGICAMSPDAASVRSATSASGTVVSELVQYGFRRGVSYDIMKLNPNGITPLRFAVNPVASPGTNGSTFSVSVLEPFVCSGSMWVQRITGGAIRVSELPSSSPLASLKSALNTRFDQYGGAVCAPNGAPPDINIKSYAYHLAGEVKWMNPGFGSDGAESTTERGKLETVADLPTAPTASVQYGPLWAFSKAVRAPSSLTAPEPANGFTPFATSDWPTLYKSGPTASGYPTSPPTPYQSGASGSGNYTPPSTTNKPLAVPRRRVLNIPLLACSPSAPYGSNAQASVAGIAKFFMTVPATDSTLIAEFAGTIPEQSLSGRVELFP